MHNFSLNAEKPDEWNILSLNFDHWVHMGKGIRSGDKDSRIYLQTSSSDGLRSTIKLNGIGGYNMIED